MKLFYMGNLEEMTAQDKKEAESFIAAREYGIIATSDSKTGARLSALANLPGSTLNESYYATEIDTQKVKNIQENPRCEFMYTDGHGQIMLSGKAQIINDVESKKAIWMDWMEEYFPGGPESSKMCIVKFTTESVRAMLA